MNWRGATLSLLLAIASLTARAEVRALLVGVSSYPALASAQRLSGPVADVESLRDVMLRRGVDSAHIRVLAEGVTGARAPTRAAILEAWAQLAREAGPGDVVFVHFSGHGSRQPDPARPGVLVPTLLPLDVGTWDGSTRSVANALTRGEVNAAIDRISERGAFVWAVFDACHSSGLVRGGGATVTDVAGVVQARGVEPGDLGVPPAVQKGWPMVIADETPHSGTGMARGGEGDAPSLARRGGSAYFYASSASEFAGELELPANTAGARRRGLLSYVLARLLDEQRPMSYRQLGQAIRATYRTIDGARVSPAFSGDGLDTQVLGQARLPVRQWPLLAPATGESAWRVGAGRIHGLGPGAVFAVLPSALAPDEDALGYLASEQVGLDGSRVLPVAYKGRLPPQPSTLRAGVHHLRLVANPAAFELRVALDPTGCAAPCRLRDAVQQLRASGVAGVDARWVGVEDAPDVRLRMHQGRVLLLTPAQAAQEPAAWVDAPSVDALPSVATEVLARQVGQRLHAHARIRNLSALAARSATDALQDALATTLRRRTDAAPFDSPVPPAVRHGDRLLLSVTNRSKGSMDVTVLYLDADEGIARVFPSNLGDLNRLEAGESRDIGVRILPPSTGRERLMLIGAQVSRSDDSIDFGFMEQASMPSRRNESEDIGEVLAAFADAAFADHRRRGEAQPRPPSARTLVRSIELDVRK